ncbi:hypothetical protein FOA52_010939 [Chlamydomonas sp. UWO 241]|nr:hypothetical protein FOA52_010939 [Chlamydomonas sp. UWO 241]
MPALVAFNRRWYIASDDFPPFAFVGCVFHGVFAVFCAACLALTETSGDGCTGLREFAIYLSCLLAIDALMTPFYAALVYVGLQGSILDKAMRSASVPLVYCVTALNAATLAVQVYGTVSLAYLGCDDYGGTWDIVHFGKAAYAFHWVSVGIFLLSSVVTFNPFDDSGSMEHWHASCTCWGLLCCIPCCDGDTPDLFNADVVVGAASKRYGHGGGSGKPMTPTSPSSGDALVPGAANPLETHLVDRRRASMRKRLSRGAGSSTTDEIEIWSTGSITARLMPRTSHNMYEMARIFHALFSHLDFTMSDIATALMLVGVLHGEGKPHLASSGRFSGVRVAASTQAHVQGSTSSAAATMAPHSQAAVRDDPALTGEGYAVPPGAPLALHVQAARSIDTAAAAAGPGALPADGSSGRDGGGDSVRAGSISHEQLELRATSGVPYARPLPPAPVGEDVLADCVHYFRHAFAVYGWPMYMFTNLSRPHRCCNVCTGCCTCCTPRRGHPTVSGAALNVTRNMSIEAIFQATRMDIQNDLLYCSFDNLVEGLLPYYVALDRERREVIIAVRGSLSQRDVLTDFLFHPERVSPEWIGGLPAGVPPGGSVYAHRGALACATAIAIDLDRTGVLRAMLLGDAEAKAALGHPIYQQDCVGWRLVVCGHSLGGAVAPLLALHLRQTYKGARCWAFACPSGTMSPLLCEASKAFCTSTVVGKDMIPRLSGHSVQRLLHEMFVAASRCRVSKTRLWATAMLRDKAWSSAELFVPEDQVDEEARAEMSRLRCAMAAAMQRHDWMAAEDFNVPGNIVYYEKVDGSGGGVETEYVARWMSQEELKDQGLVVSKRMFAMHVPDFQARVMAATLEQAGLWEDGWPPPRWGVTLSSNLGATLRVLDASGCFDLSSTNGAGSCVKLRCPWMPGCINVSDLSPLAACSETLEELWMADSGVRSLAPLQACTKLCKLDLRDCHYELYDQAEDLQLACTQLAAPSLVELAALVHTLQPNMPPDMQKDAAEALAYMIDDKDVEAALEARDAITAAGAIPALVQLLGPDCSSDVQAAAARVLHNLAGDHAQNQSAISAAGAIPALVQMLGPDCSAEVQEEAARGSS